MGLNEALGGARFLTQNQAFHALGQLGQEWEQAQALILRSIEVHSADSRDGRYVSFASPDGTAYWLRYHLTLSLWSLTKGRIPPETVV